MRNEKALDDIVNGLNAAHKILNLRNLSHTKDNRSEAPQDNLFLISEILRIITQHSPDTYRDSLSTTLNKYDLYINTYRNLRQHMISSRSQRQNPEHLLKTLAVIRPIVGDRRGILIDKILQVYEVLKS